MQIMVYENNLKVIREQQKMSIRDLAMRSDISRTHISEIENNKSDMTISTMCMLANALNVDPCDLCPCNKK